MSKLQLKGIHVYERVPNSPGMSRLVRTNPALRVGGEQGHLYIQGGMVFEEGGNAIQPENVPEWFSAEVAKCSPAALRECGYQPKAPGKTK